MNHSVTVFSALESTVEEKEAALAVANEQTAEYQHSEMSNNEKHKNSNNCGNH